MKDTLTIALFAVVLVAATAHAATVTCTDKLGRTVNVPVPVKRAVFLQTSEMIPALGIWDHVVGLGRHTYKNDLLTAAKPELGRVIPEVGTGTSVNVEVLLALRPDLVITWTIKPENVKFMEARKLRVLAEYPESVAEVYEVMRLYGALFDKRERSEAVIRAMEKTLHLVRDKISKIPREGRRKVLWLGRTSTSVSCGIGLSSEMMEFAGGTNPASSLRRGSTNVSMEQIISWDPEVIFVWGYAHYTTEDILNSPQWRSITAVRKGKVYKAPRWSTWSPRVAPLVLWMAATIYPESFLEVNPEKMIDDFYREVFGIPYEKVKKVEG